MSRFDAVIFDWAGTTVDYGCFAPVQAFAEVFRQFGIEPTMEEVRKPMGMLKRDHIRTMLSMNRIAALWKQRYNREWTENDVDELHSFFEKKLLASLESYTDVKPYVLDTVRLLRDNGIKIGSTTGYTDKMMDIVVKGAAANGYSPDAWFSPDAVGGTGRPYPYMIFENMKALHIKSVDRVIKVGDTISDIKEGVNAGVYTVGVIEGSSELGLSEAEWNTLSEADRSDKAQQVKKRFLDAGADAVIDNMGQLAKLMEL